MYARVLLALDASHAADEAARRAVALVGPSASYRLVHVQPPLPPVDLSLGAARTIMGEARDNTLVAERQRLVALADELKLHDARVELPIGAVAREVAREAREFDADLVVLGARGETRIERLLGTTARHVLRAVHVDTLIARGPAWASPPSLLVATDFYEPARAAASRAVMIARAKGGAQLTALHAIDPSIWEAANRASPPHELPDVGPRWYEETYAKMLHQFCVEHLESKAKEVVEPGRPGHVVASLARRVNADLVLVGSHGPGLVERAILGSEAERVVELAPCSVLVARPR